TVGLPGQETFLYDPITVLEKLTRRAGFRSEEFEADKASRRAAAKAAAEKKPGVAIADEEFKYSDPKFVLSNNEWGLVQPSLKRAIGEAKKIMDSAPSQVG